MKTRPTRSKSRLALTALCAGVTLATLGSCAYYNTFYVARKYYARATQGLPYRVDRADNPDNASLNKSIDFSKKLMANYPKSKWVDDAYLLWAKSFLAKNDPLQTISMLQDFPTRYPDSPLLGEAVFYRAVALRQARRYAEALQAFDEYLGGSPRGPLVPYAHLERARTLRSLDRPGDAAAAAGVLVERWPKSPLAVTARIARADANLSRGAFEEARADFHLLGQRSRTDDERLDYLLRESECLEAARRYDEALSLLRGALGHEKPPALPDTTGGRPLIIPQTPGYDRYGRLLTRIGTVQLMSGATPAALESYRRVASAYPRTPLAAEAQYRTGYAYEIGADDFESARVEYGKVRDQYPSSPFVTQAGQRQATLEQLARFRTAGGDSAEKRAQGGFLLAEQYLFQLDKPERAVAEYARIAEENRGNSWGGKALNAQAWVLRRKLDRAAEAESLHWRVVREYPATEAQIAARDYLEEMGRHVPAELIQLPPPPAPRRDSTAASARGVAPPLSPIPSGPSLLGGRGSGVTPDSATLATVGRSVFGGRPLATPPPGVGPRLFPGPTGDSAASVPPPAPDSLRGSPGGGVAPGVTSPPAVTPTRLVAPDTTTRTPLPVAPAPLGRPDTTTRIPPPAAPAPRVAADTTTRTPAPVAPAPADSGAGASAEDTTRVREPLPPLELSPVRPGITFPSGPPRKLGVPDLASLRETSSRPRAEADKPIVIGAPPAARPAPAPGAPATLARDSTGAVLPDSLRRPAVPVAGDSLRLRRELRGFEPRGSRYQ